KTDYDFLWSKQAEAIIANDRIVLETGQALSFEESAILKDGKKHFFLTQKTPLKNRGGKAIGILGVSLDITDRKEIEKRLREAKEEAELANQAKIDFVQNMR